MAHIIPDGNAPSGWQCPACRHVYGPQVSECPRCPETPPVPLFPFPGAVRLPSEYGAIPDLPPRRPRCRCSLIPWPPPAEEAETPAEACCVCGGTEVTYRNYRDQPFCGPCANGEPLGNLRPCPPSREGGTCGCDEPDDSGRRTIVMPAPMGTGVTVSLEVRRDWVTLFPGLQGRLGSFGGVNDFAYASIEFRLTPPDGQQHD